MAFLNTRACGRWDQWVSNILRCCWSHVDSKMLRAGFVPSDTPTASFLGATEMQGLAGGDGQSLSAVSVSFCHCQRRPVVSQSTADTFGMDGQRGCASGVPALDLVWSQAPGAWLSKSLELKSRFPGSVIWPDTYKYQFQLPPIGTWICSYWFTTSLYSRVVFHFV